MLCWLFIGPTWDPATDSLGEYKGISGTKVGGIETTMMTVWPLVMTSWLYVSGICECSCPVVVAGASDFEDIVDSTDVPEPS